MAAGIFEIDGYGQLELNQVAWRRDGRIEAQCTLDGTQFATAKAENGMLLAVNNTTRTVTKATSTDIGVNPIGIHYSTEHMYDERALGLKHYALSRGEFLPRIGYLAEGDKFTTNLFAYDKADGLANEAAVIAALALIATTPIYGGVSADAPGYITLGKTAATSGPLFKVIEYTTMPDGQPAIKLQVIRA